MRNRLAFTFDAGNPKAGGKKSSIYQAKIHDTNFESPSQIYWAHIMLAQWPSPNGVPSSELPAILRQKGIHKNWPHDKFTQSASQLILRNDHCGTRHCDRGGSECTGRMENSNGLRSSRRFRRRRAGTFNRSSNG